MSLKISFFFLIIITKINCSLSSYDEPFRPQLHYSAPKGWLSDPNGLFHYKGIWHMYYQYNYDAKWTEFGPMLWGHAISKDLFHWTTLEKGLDWNLTSKEYDYSGSAIIDEDNVSGLQAKGTNANKTIIVLFTRQKLPERIETQWLAYSHDEGLSYKFYEKNPVITYDPKLRQNVIDFRDPKVFKYNNYFVTLLTAGNRTELYKSSNLTHWEFLSEFGENEGSHTGIWECPDLFPMNVTINGTQVTKWVMEGVQPGSGKKTQYFIGHFDGKVFKNENPPTTVRWVDYGPDSFAGITYTNAPNGRRVFVSWMMQWAYSTTVPTVGWRGSHGIARDMRLVYTDDKILMASQPVKEIESLRVRSEHFYNITLKPNTTYEISKKMKILSRLLEIDLNADISDMTGSLSLEFKGKNDSLKVVYDKKSNEFIIDRSKAGSFDFKNGLNKTSNEYLTKPSAPRLTANRMISLRLVLDVASIELYADNGLTVMACVFYSTDNLTSNIDLNFDTNDKNSKLNVKNIVFHELKSIWK